MVDTKDTNVEPATTPIEVSPNANVLDTLQAAFRLLVVIVGAVPTVRLLLGQRDFAGLLLWFQSDGKPVVAAVATLAAIGWGLYKTHKRGAQVVTVAASPSVPPEVARLSK